MHEPGELWFYDVSPDDRIVSVSDNWDAFALENDGEDSCARYVLGRPWMDFVSGEEARLLWTTLMARARRTRLPLAIPIRCDGPSVRRFMRVRLLSKPDKTLRFCCEILREEPRDPEPILDRKSVRGDFFLKTCGWCARTEVDGAWMEVEDAVRTLRLFEVRELPAMTHGICPECYNRYSQFGL